MNTTLAKWMTAILTITFMTTPILMYIESMQREIVEVTLNEAAKKASVEGYFTYDILEGIRTTLTETYNFDPNNITIEATEDFQPRNDYIEATITVPRSPIFLFEGVFNSGPTTMTKRVRVMSEAIN
jgi:hypothetical protein